MRLSQFAAPTPCPPEDNLKLYHHLVRIEVKAESRLSPLAVNDLEVRFPLIDCLVGGVFNVEMVGAGDCGQWIKFDAEVALFSTSKAQSEKTLSDVMNIEICGADGTLSLFEPKISVVI